MQSFADLQAEVKRRATRNQAGTTYDTAVKNLINFSLLRIANETHWRPLRREASFLTVPDFSTGTVTVTADSTALVFSGANLITNGVQIGRRIKFTSGGASNILYEIVAITGENAATLNIPFDGTTTAGVSFSILGQEKYNLAIQTSKPAVVWHEANGYPYVMSYSPNRTFLESETDFDESDVPEVYFMWGEDCVINQPRTASVITCTSTSASDTTPQITIFGTVSGYPDSETVTLNGLTGVVTTKAFTKIDRITKDASTVGRVTVTANSAADSIAVLPVGDTANAQMYKKIQIFPSPDKIYEVKCLYYKEVQRLVNDDDIHELGQDFDEAIILLATAKLQGEESKRDVTTFFTMFQDELKVLKRKNADKLDWLPRLQKPGRRGAPAFHSQARYSQAGSKFGPVVL
jgi:hypothetical protein